MKKISLPQMLSKYFWDCDFENLSMNQYGFFITERILNYGNIPSLQWLFTQIDKVFLAEVIDKSRNLNKKTRNYWNLVLHG
jgi:hypothetical protein